MHGAEMAVVVLRLMHVFKEVGSLWPYGVAEGRIVPDSSSRLLRVSYCISTTRRAPRLPSFIQIAWVLTNNHLEDDLGTARYFFSAKT